VVGRFTIVRVVCRRIKQGGSGKRSAVSDSGAGSERSRRLPRLSTAGRHFGANFPVFRSLRAGASLATLG